MLATGSRRRRPRAALRVARVPRLGRERERHARRSHDGETSRCATRTPKVLRRPGHSPVDTIFWDDERRVLIAADHLIKHISSNPLISRPLDREVTAIDRPRALMTYLGSLRKTREMPAELVLPGHGEPITDHVALIEERFRMHKRRAEKIYGLIASKPHTAYEIAQALWGNVAVTQAFLTLSEVLGHIDLLLVAQRIREDEDADDVVHFVLAE